MITLLAGAVRPVYCLALEISSCYWAADLSSTQLCSELMCSIRLHNTLTEGTLWSFLQALDQVSATHACSRRRLYLPWDAASRKLGMEKNGMQYQEAAKMEDEVREQAKEGTGLIKWAPFSPPFAFLLLIFLFQPPFLVLFPNKEQAY